MPAAERAPIIEKAKAGEKVSARTAAKTPHAAPPVGDVEKRHTATSDELKALMTAWNRAGPEARKTFLLRVNATAR